MFKGLAAPIAINHAYKNSFWDEWDEKLSVRRNVAVTCAFQIRNYGRFQFSQLLLGGNSRASQRERGLCRCSVPTGAIELRTPVFGE